MAKVLPMKKKQPKYDPRADERVTFNEDGSISLILDKPVVIKGKGPKDQEVTIDVLSFRSPRVGDLEAADNGGSNITTSITLAAALSDQLVSTIKKLEMGDWSRVQGVISSFFPNSEDDSEVGED